MKTVILASKSPRRKELLRQLGLYVTVLASNNHTLCAFEGDEEQLPEEKPYDYVCRTAFQKFQQGCQRARRRGLLGMLPIVAADTVVVYQGKVLGKPVDQGEALSFLQALSGQVHEVMTAVVVGISRSDFQQCLQRTRVTFARLTPEQMLRYVRSSEPYDKAGGYGIQGLAGAFISSIHGSFTGVMGLPIHRTVALLQKYNVNPLQKDE